VKYLVSILLLLVVIVFLLVTGILLHNRAQLLTTPGIAERLKIYLTQNSVQTSAQHRFPELRSAHFQVTEETLFRAVQSAVVNLGWSLSAENADSGTGQYRLHALVTTPVFRFQDDVMILVHGQDCRHGSLDTILDVRSSSRVGKGDLAANAGHVQSLLEQVRLELERQRPATTGLSVCQSAG